MNGIFLLCFKTFAACLELLGIYQADLLARTYCAIWLFSTNTPIAAGTELSDLTPATYPGYAPIPVTVINGPDFNQGTNLAYLTTAEAYFTCAGGGSGNQVYSAALVATIPGSTQATGTVTTTGGEISLPVVTAPAQAIPLLRTLPYWAAAPARSSRQPWPAA